jgi:hypothetical protein
LDPKTVAAIEANSLKSYCTTTTGGSVGKPKLIICKEIQGKFFLDLDID